MLRGQVLRTRGARGSALPVAKSARTVAAPKYTTSRRATVVAMAASAVEVPIKEVPTKPIAGQKTGTSGLRKKTEEFTSENYLANWVQSLFNALGDEAKGETLALGGDGRYFGKEAAQIIIKVAAGNGFKKVLVGQDAILATPAASAVIRERKLYGGLIMSASHNPGGPDADFGIKFNYKSGEPAPERITDKIFGETQKISVIKMADIPDVDLSKLGSTNFGGFEVEVIDPISDYLTVLQRVFDFPSLKAFVSHPDFSMTFDAMHAVTGPYAQRIFVKELGAAPESIKNGVPLPDFGGGHPDPNLTYAHDLVEVMKGPSAPVLGAASDGDGDRNMVLGPNFFVSPSDSVAMIAANAKEAIKYFSGGLKGVARSMPTGGALDRVATKLGIEFFETPTGWKFFGNLMDAGRCSLCGEESFGTGADHIREKDGIFAVLCWLSLLAHANKNTPAGSKLVSIEDIAYEFWKVYGRNFFSRYDYEQCSSESANKMMDHVRGVIAASPPGTKFGAFTLKFADDFEYTDPVDGSVAKGQGLRFVFEDGSRIIFRLSGTGSSGATIRLYIEQYTNEPARLKEDAQVALADIIKVALELSKLKEFTGRDKPTVIT